jgi:hypothetical protein
MGCPAGVPHTDAAAAGIFKHRPGQLVDPSDRSVDINPAIAMDGDAGAVVAAVFQPPQALDQEGAGIPLADVSDNAAHALFAPLCSLFA